MRQLCPQLEPNVLWIGAYLLPNVNSLPSRLASHIFWVILLPMKEQSDKILVVDDDQRLRQLLERYLREQGFVARAVENAEAMDRAMAREHYDLLVLDLMMPGEDGLSICRRLRGAKSDIAIIMLTAKGDDIDRIVGLELGADDYLPKPFNPRELVARVNAVLRRRVASVPGAPAEMPEVIRFADCTIDLGMRTLVRGDAEHALTTGEFALLKALVTHPRQPMSRDHLSEMARGREYEVFDRAIDVQISRLRKLVEVDPSKPRHIQTVRGFGYVFVPGGEPADNAG
jgi:two-component system phosphate regulon response regulator OmpR